MPLTTDAPRPEEFAAIDLGSNSFHMIIARVVDGALQPISRIKQQVHLAGGLDGDNLLSEDSMDVALASLALFSERLQGFKASNIRVVGTHTLRQATNTLDFLKRASKVFPYPIEVISGQEEARLIFMGVEHTQPDKGCKLVVDIGGGSTELVIGKNFEPILLASRRMGCVSFAQHIFPNGKISADRFARATMIAVQKLESIAPQFRQHGWDVALGSSGTIKAIRKVLIEMGESDGIITLARLEQLRDAVLKFNNFDELDLPGLLNERKGVFVPGLAILCGVFSALGIKKMHYSDGALREGVLYEMEGGFRHEDIRSRTTLSMANQHSIDRDQAYRVLETTTELYQQWEAQNPKLVSPELADLLKWSVLLHEVGININHSGMHRHSAYIVQNSNLPGFNQEQQLLMSTLINFHRKAIKLEEIPAFALYKKKQLLPLIQLFRLGVLLNNQRQATTKPDSLVLKTDYNHWTLHFPANWFNENALVLLDLEREKQYWGNVIGWNLLLEENDLTHQQWTQG